MQAFITEEERVVFADGDVAGGEGAVGEEQELF